MRANFSSTQCHAFATHRLLVIALSLSDRSQEASVAARSLLLLEPTFSVSGFAQRYPGREAKHAPSYFKALLKAGVLA
jgi:hypothetical protein